MTPFEEWWHGPDNPIRTMPESTREQMKWAMREAFNAGRKNPIVKADRKSRLVKFTLDA